MKILMVNKFLYPKGGAETYMLKLGAYLQTVGHEIQYFGMDDEKRTVGNEVNAYTKTLDFHYGSFISRITYPFRIIYSAEARKKIRLVLDDFQPDVCHLNNFNYQLTPSIILEIRKWEKESGSTCKIIYTAHDYQLVCPNHMCRNPLSNENCEKCLRGNYISCIKGKCVHGSVARSVIGAAEAMFWKTVGVYKQFDKIICCSRFMKTKLDTNPILAEKTIALHNFIDKTEPKVADKKNYVLYFGRYSQEKGIAKLVQAAKEMPEVQFVFAGSGPLEHLLHGVSNIRNVGFQSGSALETFVREARFSVYPSEWYENCPFSVMESIVLGTPVLGARIGGIPELIEKGKTGELFESGNVEALKARIEKMWQDTALVKQYSKNCFENVFATVEEYADKLIGMFE